MFVRKDPFAHLQYPCVGRQENKFGAAALTALALGVILLVTAFLMRMGVSVEEFRSSVGASILYAGGAVLLLVPIIAAVREKLGKRVIRDKSLPVEQLTCTIQNVSPPKYDNKKLDGVFAIKDLRSCIFKYLTNAELTTFGIVCKYFHYLMHKAVKVKRCEQFDTSWHVEKEGILCSGIHCFAGKLALQTWEAQKSGQNGQSLFALKSWNWSVVGTPLFYNNGKLLVRSSEIRIDFWDLTQNRILRTVDPVANAYLYQDKMVAIVQTPFNDSVRIWNNDNDPVSWELPKLGFAACAFVNEKWLVGTAWYLDLERQKMIESKNLPPASTRSAYKDSVIYLSENGAIYMNQLPKLEEAICLSSGWDKDTVMFTNHDYLYLQEPLDGRVFRYDLTTYVMGVVLRLGEPWKMAGICGGYLIATNDSNIRVFEI